MPEAVIVATARSPIGRAFKGSLVDVRPDDLAAQMVQAALAQVPQLELLNAPIRRRKSFSNAAGQGLSVLEAKPLDRKACDELNALMHALF